MRRESIRIAYPSTLEGYQLLNAIDQQFLGTDNYMGVAYFWAYEYRHALRDASKLQRVRCHNAFRKAGLALDGVSPAHEAIVGRLFPKSGYGKLLAKGARP